MSLLSLETSSVAGAAGTARRDKVLTCYALASTLTSHFNRLRNEQLEAVVILQTVLMVDRRQHPNPSNRQKTFHSKRVKRLASRYREGRGGSLYRWQEEEEQEVIMDL